MEKTHKKRLPEDPPMVSITSALSRGAARHLETGAGATNHGLSGRMGAFGARYGSTGAARSHLVADGFLLAKYMGFDDLWDF